MRTTFDRTPLRDSLDIIRIHYENGLSAAKIATLFDCHPESIRLLLHKLGIKVRSQKESCTKYSINSSFFNNIDTEEKAYWLGFITADGGIVGHQLLLTLSQKDENHIRKFLSALNSSHPIKTVASKINGKTIYQPKISISCKEIIKALNELGVFQNKSFTVRPPIISESLKKHYWRGVIDGDGHIYAFDLSREIGLTGNQFILRGYADHLKQTLEIESNIEKHKNVWKVRHSRRSCVFSIANYLYNGSMVYLDRKFAIANTIFSDSFFCIRKNSKLRRTSFEEVQNS